MKGRTEEDDGGLSVLAANTRMIFHIFFPFLKGKRKVEAHRCVQLGEGTSQSAQPREHTGKHQFSY